MPTLLSISDLKKAPKKMFQKMGLLDRIDSLLEDMNLSESEKPDIPVLKLDIRDKGRRTGVFHASAVGSQSGKSLCGRYMMGCGRELYYGYTGAEMSSAREPRNRRILDTGHAIHLQLQSYLLAVADRSDGSEKFTMEVDIDPDTNEVAGRLDLSGHTDGIYEISDGQDDIRIGVEIKSINDSGYKDLTKPHREHQTQATIYQKCLDLPVMVFLYYNKNDSSIAEYLQVFDEDLWGAVERKLEYVRECAMKGKDPEREVSRSCAYCSFKPICKPPRTAPHTSMSRAHAFRRG